jgi:hypothetical protein
MVFVRCAVIVLQMGRNPSSLSLSIAPHYTLSRQTLLNCVLHAPVDWPFQQLSPLPPDIVISACQFHHPGLSVPLVSRAGPDGCRGATLSFDRNSALNIRVDAKFQFPHREDDILCRYFIMPAYHHLLLLLQVVHVRM